MGSKKYRYVWVKKVQNFKLQVSGNAIADAWFTWSDSTIKENMNSIPNNTIAKIMKLEPLMYNYKSEIDLGTHEENNNTDSLIQDKVPNPNQKLDSGIHFGFTAQAISRVFPNIVRGIGTIEAVNYIELVPVLVKGMQEQQKTIDSQKLEIATLREEIIAWKGRSIDSTIVNQTRLFQNDPNPFDANTKFSYFIDESTNITSAAIEIRNIMGIIQNTLPLNDRSGLGEITYDGSSLVQGYYIFTLKVNGVTKDSKMFLKEQ